MLFLITLGFDEKFAIRSVVRKGLQDKDKIIVVTPEPSVEQCNRSYFSLRETIQKISNKVEIIRLEVPYLDFKFGVRTIRKCLENFKGEEILVNVSGGMRILIIQVLFASILSGLEAMVEIETEDSKARVAIPISMLRGYRLEGLDKEIINYLYNNGGAGLEDIFQNGKHGRSTIWRRLQYLISLALVEKNGKKYMLSENGLIMAN